MISSVVCFSDMANSGGLIPSYGTTSEQILITIDGTKPPTRIIRPMKTVGFRVKFIAWNPLSPPAIPVNASVLWLESRELSPSGSNSCLDNFQKNIIASWNLAGTEFNGKQMFVPFQRDPLEVQEMTFKLYTDIGEVIATTLNKVIVSIEFWSVLSMPFLKIPQDPFGMQQRVDKTMSIDIPKTPQSDYMRSSESKMLSYSGKNFSHCGDY